MEKSNASNILTKKTHFIFRSFFNKSTLNIKESLFYTTLTLSLKFDYRKVFSSIVLLQVFFIIKNDVICYNIPKILHSYTPCNQCV